MDVKNLLTQGNRDRQEQPSADVHHIHAWEIAAQIEWRHGVRSTDGKLYTELCVYAITEFPLVM